MRKISEIFINGICLKEILEKHKKWLDKKDGGERADLSYANLSYADLSYTDLKGANLICANLSGADLSYADLRGADLNHTDLGGADLRGADLSCTRLNCTDLSYANLRNSNLRNADLSSANLWDVNLIGVNLSCANLISADLSDANLNNANLSNANLRGANLNKVLYNYRTSFFTPVCPEKGSFIGYKKADNKIVELLITEDSERSSATTRKCRCSKAKVLSITNIENTEEFSEVISDFDKNFIYKVGEIVEVKDFDEDRWNECSTGIHFFITRDEAIIYRN